MTNHVRLDNIQHKDLSVKQHYAAAYGHNVGAVFTFPGEYADIAREYPIMLRKDSNSDSFQALAMLGLAPDENLFLQSGGQGWNANYVPAAFARGPFLIGYEDQTQSGGEPNAAVIHIDMDDPRVNAEEGKAVFMPHGGNTPYLDSVANVLNGITQGLEVGDGMLKKLNELSLIEPLAMDIELVNGDKIRIEGHHTINQERVSSLSGDELLQLNQAGFLEGIFIILGSLHNVNRLIALKNAQIASR